MMERDPTVKCVPHISTGGRGNSERTPNLVPDEEARAPVVKQACLLCRQRKKRCLHVATSDDAFAADVLARMRPGPAPGSQRTPTGSQSASLYPPVRGARCKTPGGEYFVPAGRKDAGGVERGSAGAHRRVVSCAECRRKKQRCRCGTNGTVPLAIPAGPHNSALSEVARVREATGVKQACFYCRQRKKRCPHSQVEGVWSSGMVNDDKASHGEHGRVHVREGTSHGSDLHGFDGQVKGEAFLPESCLSVLIGERSSTSSLASVTDCKPGRGASAKAVRLSACDQCRQRRIRCVHMHAREGATSGRAINDVFKASKRRRESRESASMQHLSKKLKAANGKCTEGERLLIKALQHGNAGRGMELQSASAAVTKSNGSLVADDGVRFVPCADCKRRKRKCWCANKLAHTMPAKQVQYLHSGNANSSIPVAGIAGAAQVECGDKRDRWADGGRAVEGAAGVKIEGRDQVEIGTGGVKVASGSGGSEREEVNWLLEFAQLAQVLCVVWVILFGVVLVGWLWQVYPCA
jgi:hypothetical protein